MLLLVTAEGATVTYRHEVTVTYGDYDATSRYEVDRTDVSVAPAGEDWGALDVTTYDTLLTSGSYTSTGGTHYAASWTGMLRADWPVDAAPCT